MFCHQGNSNNYSNTTLSSFQLKLMVTSLFANCKQNYARKVTFL